MTDVTEILARVEQGDGKAAESLLPLVYHELRQLAALQMAQEMPGQTLQATALVHEAYLRLVKPDSGVKFANRRHFFGAAAQAMRRILVEQARRKARIKHGGAMARVEFGDIASAPSDEALLALDGALDRLAAEDPLAAEVVNLKYFAGLGREAIAEMLGITVHETRSKWAYARSWLQVAVDK